MLGQKTLVSTYIKLYLNCVQHCPGYWNSTVWYLCTVFPTMYSIAHHIKLYSLISVHSIANNVQYCLWLTLPIISIIVLDVQLNFNWWQFRWLSSQGHHSHILMTGVPREFHIFSQNNPNFRICLPQKFLTFLSISTKKPLSVFLKNSKMVQFAWRGWEPTKILIGLISKKNLEIRL